MGLSSSTTNFPNPNSATRPEDIGHGSRGLLPQATHGGLLVRIGTIQHQTIIAHRMQY